MAWDEDGFRERIQRRADELGLSIREVMRQAGLPEDTFKADRRKLPRGRTFNTIEKIAQAVDLSVPEALGYSPIVTGPVDRKLLIPAVHLAYRALQSDPEREQVLPETVADTLDVLTELHREGTLNQTPMRALEIAITIMVSAARRKQLGIDEQTLWAGNALASTGGTPAPSSKEASDPPTDEEDLPPKMAAPDDTEYTLAA